MGLVCFVCFGSMVWFDWFVWLVGLVGLVVCFISLSVCLSVNWLVNSVLQLPTAGTVRQLLYSPANFFTYCCSSFCRCLYKHGFYDEVSLASLKLTIGDVPQRRKG